MNFELLRVAIALIGTGILAYQDYRTSFVDDKAIYVMIAGGILLNILTLDFDFMLLAIGGAVVIFAIGQALYRTGQFGAGDVLLFAALHLLLPFAPIETAKLLNATQLVNSNLYVSAAGSLPFFLIVLVTASVIALVGSSATYAWLLHLKKTKWNPQAIPLIGLTVLSIAFIAWFNSLYPLSALQLTLLCIVAVSSIFTTAMKKQIMAEVIVQKVPISEIEDEDVIATEAIKPEILKQFNITRVATEQVVAQLKKLSRQRGIKTFPVYKHLPRFVPYLLIALILSVLVLNPLAFMLFL